MKRSVLGPHLFLLNTVFLADLATAHCVSLDVSCRIHLTMRPFFIVRSGNRMLQEGVGHWNYANLFKLNSDKTELIWTSLRWRWQTYGLRSWSLLLIVNQIDATRLERSLHNCHIINEHLHSADSPSTLRNKSKTIAVRRRAFSYAG